MACLMFFLSYVEDTLEHNKVFNAEGLLASDNSFEGRLKFWTKRLCAERPQTFDIVLAVRNSSIPHACPGD